MRGVKVLVLEDDLETVEIILKVFRSLENEKNVSISATILPDYIKVKEFINKNPEINFDMLLLDRDCYLGGSFHVVNLNSFDKEKVISISSVPGYNREAQEMGVKRTILKDFQNLDIFKVKLKKNLLEII